MDRKKQIFVIDDELQTRKVLYEKVLGPRYLLSFSENADTIYQDIKNSNADLYIVDLNLTAFKDPITHDDLNIVHVIKEIGKTKPIIILSGDYNLLIEKKKLSPAVSYFSEGGYNICTFLSWDEISSLNDEESLNSREALYQKLEFAIYKDKTPYDFGVICALEEELAPFLEKATITGPVNNSDLGIRFRKGIIQTNTGHDLSFIAAYSTNMGIADASIIATTMVTRFSVGSIFMIGVCGGREAEKVKIGDIIIPKASVAYQRGKLTNQGFSAEIQYAHPKETLLAYDNSQNEQILSGLFGEYVQRKAEEGEVPGIKKPKVINEVIACADYVIDKDGELDRISEDVGQRKLCGVDMESYAVYRVGEILDVSTLVIKAVMDLTNKKSDMYKPYAAYMSANFLYQLLYRELIIFPKS